MGFIYLVTNDVNGKRYVGQTTRSFSHRKQQHISDAKRSARWALARAIRKYGKGSFSWRVLGYNDSQFRLNCLERIMIYALNTKVPNGYNMTDGGEGASGYRQTSETRRKISKALHGKKKSTLHRLRISLSKQGACSPWKGKHHSEEAKRILSEKARGRRLGPMPASQRLKISKALKGRVFTEEHNRKVSEALKGKKRKPHSKETKDKMRLAALHRWAKYRLEKQSEAM